MANETDSEMGRSGQKNAQMQDQDWDTDELEDQQDEYEFGMNPNDQGGFEDIQPDYWTYSEYWIVPGPFLGVGPRGYTRSDDRILEQVCSRLTENGRLDASQIDVSVDHGQVTLDGNVDSRSSKRLAEDIAESVWGVNDVHNQLRINPYAANTGTREEQSRRIPVKSETSETQAPQIPVNAGTAASANEPNLPRRKYTSAGTEIPQQMPTQNMATRPDHLREGMDVLDSKGIPVGHVKAIRDDDFLVDRPLARDVYAPFSAIAGVTEQRVTLNVAADEIDKQGWMKPPIFGPEPPRTGDIQV